MIFLTEQVGIIDGSVFAVVEDDPEIVDTLAIKLMIVQLMTFICIGSILYVGMLTARLSDHGLRYILLLRKAQQFEQQSGMYYSTTKKVCLLISPNESMMHFKQQIEKKLGIPVQRIICADGPADDVDRLHASRVWRKERKEYEEQRAHLVKKKVKGQLSELEQARLEWLQAYFQEHDRLETPHGLEKLADKLKRRLDRQSEQQQGNEDAKRLEWVKLLLDGNPENLKVHHHHHHLDLKSPMLRTLNGPYASTAPVDACVPMTPLAVVRAGTGIGVQCDDVNHFNQWQKYQLVVRDGHDLVVEKQQTSRNDIQRLKEWWADATDEEKGDGILVVDWEQGDATQSLWARVRQLVSSPSQHESDLCLSTSPTAPMLSPASPTASEATETFTSSGAYANATAAERFEHRLMLDALADIMEEERIPPNLRHLPMAEDTRPTIQVPIYGPIPISPQFMTIIFGVIISGMGTSVTALYGSTL